VPILVKIDSQWAQIKFILIKKCFIARVRGGFPV
jgi:hypothetical protein